MLTSLPKQIGGGAQLTTLNGIGECNLVISTEYLALIVLYITIVILIFSNE